MIAEDYKKLVRYMEKRVAANKPAYDKASSNYHRALKAGLQPYFLDNLATAVQQNDITTITRYGHAYTSNIARREMMLAKLAGNSMQFAYWRGLMKLHLNIYLGEYDLNLAVEDDANE